VRRRQRGACRQARRTGAACIALLLDNILPGLRDLPAELAEDAEMRAAVKTNVRWSMHQMLETPGQRPTSMRAR
jgi:hypothetical protein